MEQQNFINTLRSFYRERPFRQFEIELASGKAVRVVHPDALAFMGQRAVVLTTDGLHHHLDHHGVVRISETGEEEATGIVGLKENGHPS